MARTNHWIHRRTVPSPQLNPARVTVGGPFLQIRAPPEVSGTSPTSVLFLDSGWWRSVAPASSAGPAHPRNRHAMPDWDQLVRYLQTDMPPAIVRGTD